MVAIQNYTAIGCPGGGRLEQEFMTQKLFVFSEHVEIKEEKR